MKIIKGILIIIALLSGSLCSSLQAKVYDSVMIYYGVYKNEHATLKVYVDFSTVGFGAHADCTAALYYGRYYTCTWTPDIADPPTILLQDYGSANNSNCPGLLPGWECYFNQVRITVPDQDYCPWTARVYTVSKTSSGGSYTGPSDMLSTCTVNVSPYDISWYPDTVEHNLLFNLKSTGGIITKNLHTYLMKDKKLCDGSKSDERGAYCRYVNTYTKMTPAGCGDSRVKATAVARGINETALHDITLSIDTTSPNPIDTTCQFLYVMEPQ
ncbi:DUF2544 domain-containing protein [Salmonella enterica]|nr:DUF2544 domain-containing protein [Salmonella enterica]